MRPHTVRPAAVRRLGIALGIGCVTLAGCVSAPDAPADPLCIAIADFAASAPSTQMLQIDLVGGRRSNPPGPEHYCRHRGSEPGEKLCNYLVPHTTWEFGKPFAEKAFQCLTPGTYRRARAQLSSGAPLVEATSRLNGPEAPSRSVWIAYEAGEVGGLFSLKIGTR
jgi:hypothetical protein